MSQQSPVEISKTPSVMRYDRVQTILEGDAALKGFLGPKDQEVKKRNGDKHFYARGVVLVTNVLHARNFDAHNVSKSVVLCIGYEVLIEKPQKLKVADKPKTEPALEPTSVPKTGVKKTKLKAEVKPKSPKPAISAKVIRSRAGKKPQPASKDIAKPEPAAAPAAPAAAAAPVAAAVASNSASAASKPVFYIYGTALSHAVTIFKTLEIGDRNPGAEARLETVSKLIDQLKPVANVPVPMPDDFDNALKHVKAAPSSKG